MKKPAVDYQGACETAMHNIDARMKCCFIRAFLCVCGRLLHVFFQIIDTVKICKTDN